MKHFRIVLKFILHFLTAKHSRGFKVHSPFVYSFIRFVLCEKCVFYKFQTIENLRLALLKDKRTINISDFGSGNGRVDTVSNIARKSVKSAKYGQLLFRMVHYFHSKNVLELGTSLGITTAYLASSSSEICCKSLEGCPQIASMATENIKKLGIKNIEIIEGDIDKTLAETLTKFEKLDFVFIDANHHSEAILRYFELCIAKTHNASVIVIDDIYWSSDMEKAWKSIQNHASVRSTIDIFQLGIVFFNTDLNKMHYKMRY